MSEAPISDWIADKLQQFFGIGAYLLPVFFLGLGSKYIITKEKLIIPPTRVFAFLFFFAATCGIINLFTPLDESLAYSPTYGGGLGFAFGFIFRQFFGEMVAWIVLIGIFWLAGTVAFGIKISNILRLIKNGGKLESRETLETATKNGFKILNKSTTATKKIATNEPELKYAKTKRFQNEVKIIDSSEYQDKSKKTGQKTSISLDKKDDKDQLSKAKNQKFGDWEPPSLDLLKTQNATITVDEKKLRQKAESIREKLEQFNIEVIMRSVHVGPTVTQFTLEPAAGVKLTKITALRADLALALAAENIRIEAPIRGKKLVGIEIPNDKRAIVGMREILESEAWENEKSELKLALGRDVSGKPVVANLAKMPHLLIAGKTGSGKSVAMNAFLVSLLWNNSPERLRLILVDPKRVELAPYNHLPHLLTPVITEPEKSVSALAWAVAEMNRRYKDFSVKRCRNLEEHNVKFPDEKEPFIVIVIDELADLMMVAGKDVEAAICRIAQMARAVGMHLIIATQRPSVDVVTGLIKANLPARMSFKVSSGIDSRTIIDGVGAEDLLGFGDMLNLDGNSGILSRVQGLYVSSEEVERITNHIKLQYPESIGKDEMKEEITQQSIEGMAKGGVLTAGVKDNETKPENLDTKYEEAVDLVFETGIASASFML